MKKIEKISFLGKRYKTSDEQRANGAPNYMRLPLGEGEVQNKIIDKLNEIVEVLNTLNERLNKEEK
jgi:hypothetical protein